MTRPVRVDQETTEHEIAQPSPGVNLLIRAHLVTSIHLGVKWVKTGDFRGRYLLEKGDFD
jgi:hypothetical protein